MKPLCLLALFNHLTMIPSILSSENDQSDRSPLIVPISEFEFNPELNSVESLNYEKSRHNLQGDEEYTPSNGRRSPVAFYLKPRDAVGRLYDAGRQRQGPTILSDDERVFNRNVLDIVDFMKAQRNLYSRQSNMRRMRPVVEKFPGFMDKEIKKYLRRKKKRGLTSIKHFLGHM